jgi:hypothetical protein
LLKSGLPGGQREGGGGKGGGSATELFGSAAILFRNRLADVIELDSWANRPSWINFFPDLDLWIESQKGDWELSVLKGCA